MSFLQTLNKLFGDEEPANQKAQRSNSGGKAVGKSIKTGFTPEDKEWLKDCLVAVGEHQTSEIREQLKPLTKSVKEQELAIAELKKAREDDNNSVEARLGPLETDHTKLTKQVTTMQAELAVMQTELKTLKSGTAGSASSSAASSFHPSKICILGNLCNYLLKEEAEDEARKILIAAGVESSWYTDLRAPFGFNRSVNMKFQNEEDFHKTRQAIKTLNHKATGFMDPCFLDIKKTNEQRRPGKFWKAMKEQISSLVVATDGMDRAKVVVCDASKHIYYQHRLQIAGHMPKEEVTWTWGEYGEQSFLENARTAAVLAADKAAK